MRILVTGSRDWPRPAVVEDAIANQLEGVHYNAVIVHGDCPTGADAQAQAFCERFSITTERYPAQWDKFGKSAGPKKNKEMVDLGADVVLAFVETNSRGTRNCVNHAYDAGLPIIVHELDDKVTGGVRRTYLNSMVMPASIHLFSNSKFLGFNPWAYA